MLPDFVNIGAQKAGGTALYVYLAGHPCVVASWWKETIFFGGRFQKGVRWYRSHFPLRVTKRLAVRLRGQPCLTGEATPYYLFHPAVPARMREVIPDVKLIALLRNPVDRTISQYHHEVRKGFEDLPMEEALAAEDERLASEEENLLKAPGYYSYSHQHHSYKARSVYIDQIGRWASCFPRSQMLILKSEDFFERPCETFQEVLRFLGLPPWEPKQFAPYNVGTCPAAEADLRERLQVYFAPHNQRRYEYLGVDWRWEP